MRKVGDVWGEEWWWWWGGGGFRWKIEYSQVLGIACRVQIKIHWPSPLGLEITQSGLQAASCMHGYRMSDLLP